MKTPLLVIALSVSTALLVQLQLAEAENENPYTATDRSAHETVWQRVEWQTNQVGEAVARTNAFVEIAAGQNFFDKATQAWQSSREEWQVYPDAIVALAGRHNVILATNLNLGGAVDVLTPEGVRLISNPVGLGFFDPVDGKHTTLAEIKDCVPRWGAATNEIIFHDCFNGIRGSMRYLYTRAGIQQHVILEQRLQLPEGFSDKSRLECYTEFAPATPWPRITTRVLRRENDPVLRGQMVEPDFTDSELDFGELAMRAGTAFTLSGTPEARSIRVGKRFELVAGRPVLTESVEFELLEPLLARLAAVERPKAGLFAINSSRQLPPAKKPVCLPREHFRTTDTKSEIQLASSPLSQPAVVIDYELLGSTNNYTLRGDTTYYVSGYISLSGITTLEGGTVIKYTNRTSAYILVDNLNCKTDQYRPAIFTSKDDNTVGDTLPGSTGSPTNYPGGSYITTSTTNTYTHLRMSYAGQGIGVEAADLNIWHCQFSRCNQAIFVNDYGYVNLHNVLFSRCATAVSYGDGVKGEQVTADQINTFLAGSSGSLTNSIFTAVTNVGLTLYNSATNSNGSGVYQPYGAGSYYLADSSTNRNAGTTSINAALANDLKNQTTFPPHEITTNFTGDTMLTARDIRDSDSQPDRGYHYDPLDYVISGRSLTDSTLTLSNGVGLGTYGTSSSYGLALNSGNFVSEGTPTHLNWIVRYNTVQEQSTTNWSATSVAPAVKIQTGSPAMRASFTGWSLLGGVGDHLNDISASTNVSSFTDCRFGGGQFTVNAGSAALTNCLWERVYVSLNDLDEAGMKWYLYNNLFYGGKMSYKAVGENPVMLAYDNFFDQTAITKLSGSDNFTHDYNGYVTNKNRLYPNGAHDVLLINNPVYQAIAFDRFYYPTNDGNLSRLINGGSQTALTAGLANYTTQTNQMLDRGTVDIGFHYALVATNGNQVGTIVWFWPNTYCGSPIYSSPAVGANGTIYFTAECDLFAIDPTGHLLWTDSIIDDGEFQSSPTVGTNGTIYVGSSGGTLYAVDPATGANRWTLPTNPVEDILSTPALGADGTIYFGGDANTLGVDVGGFYAVVDSGSTGSLKSNFNGGAPIFPTNDIESSAAIWTNGTIYFVTEEPFIHAVSPNGTNLWEYQLSGGGAGEVEFPVSPSIGSDGTVYIGDSSGKLYAFHGGSNIPQVKWAFTNTPVGDSADAITTTAVIGPDGSLYYGTQNNLFYAVSTNGVLKWSYAFTNSGVGSIYGTPAIAADGTIYVSSTDNNLYAMPSDLSATNGPLWQVQVLVTPSYPVTPSPAIGTDGLVYICGGPDPYGLYAVQGTAGPAISPWPLWRRNNAHQANAALR